MKVEVVSQITRDGRYLSVAKQINDKLNRNGVNGRPFVVREAACIRYTQAAAEAVAVLDLCLMGLLESYSVV